MNEHRTLKPTREQKIAVVKNFRQSGMSQKAFAELHTIPLSQLNYWCKEYVNKWSKPHRKAEEWPTPRTMDDLTSQGKAIDVAFTRTQPDEPDWRKLYEDERAKVEALQKAILVLGHQL